MNSSKSVCELIVLRTFVLYLSDMLLGEMHKLYTPFKSGCELWFRVRFLFMLDLIEGAYVVRSDAY